MFQATEYVAKSIDNRTTTYMPRLYQAHPTQKHRQIQVLMFLEVTALCNMAKNEVSVGAKESRMQQNISWERKFISDYTERRVP